MAIEAVVFDLDGTLTDTLQDLCDSVNHIMNGYGWPERTREEVRCFVGSGAENLMARAIPGGRDEPRFREALKDYKKWYSAHSAEKTVPYPGVVEVLETLKGKGIKIGVVSNKPMEPVLQLTRRFFGGLVDAAMGETPELRRKPEPDMVEEILRILHCPRERAVYVGDSEVDILTGKRAGLPCISVTWGFRDRAVLEQAGAETFACDAQELLKCLGQ